MEITFRVQLVVELVDEAVELAVRRGLLVADWSSGAFVVSRYNHSGASNSGYASDAQASVQLALAQPSISSQLVDNLNASIHLRALLTDLFLIDEVLKGHR